MITRALDIAPPRRPIRRGRPKPFRVLQLLAIASAIGGVVSATPAIGATFTVTSTSDSATDGESLRWAIDQANTQPGDDDILFDIPNVGNAAHVIAPATDLPPITDQVTVDGYSQPGAVTATRRIPAELRIVIDATATTRGLALAASGSVVRGLVVNNAGNDGITVTGSDNVIAGNYIGTDVTGMQAALNFGDGVVVNGGANRIGGSAAADSNLISGNNFDGVDLESGSGNVIQGNKIGPDVTGNGVLGVNQDGIEVDQDSPGNVIGGPGRGEGNVISGAGAGVDVDSSANTVQGNKIGTNATGETALPNAGTGIRVTGDANVIGGAAPGQGNLVAGNEFSGITISTNFATTPDPPDGNRVEGNLIGTNAAGRAALPNGADGVLLWDAHDNTIGGTEPGARNVIAGNDGNGIKVFRFDESQHPDGNQILGNQIGTDAAGTRELGNGESGVRIDGANNTDVGDATEAGANTIANNTLDGVTVLRGVDNTVLVNSIHSNDDLGIDLGDDGRTDNDPALDQDVDTGANNLQNHPDVNVALQAFGGTTLSWSLDSLPSTAFRIDLYGNDVCKREGQSFLGSVTATTDAAGHAADSTFVSADNFAFVTATASTYTLLSPLTREAPGPIFTFDGRSTSEFSQCREASFILPDH